MNSSNLGLFSTQKTLFSIRLSIEKQSNFCRYISINLVSERKVGIKSQVVYTDGSCRMLDTKTRFGGIGVFWGKNDPRNTSKILKGTPTNSRGEISAVIEAIKMSDPDSPLLVITDSSYVIKVVSRIRKNVLNNLENIDLVNQLGLFLSDKISFEHVLKRSKIPGNEAADKLARTASKLAMERYRFKCKV